MKRHAEYKDSGIAWVGKVPKAWQIMRLKNILVERKEKNDPIQTDFILSLTAEKGVIPYSEKNTGGNKAKEDISKYKLAYPGDVVLNSMNVVSGAVGLSNYFGAVSPVYYTLYPRTEKCYIKYYNNIFQSYSFQRSLLGLGNGILVKYSEETDKLNTVRLRIPIDKLNNILLPIPSMEEQIKISSYLDDRRSQIDELITNKLKLIDLLAEKRQVIISETVTKGLDKNVKMKDSDVEWIGEMPEGWKTKKFGYLFSFGRGLNITKADLLDEGVPCVSYGEIHSKYGFEVNPDVYPLRCVDTEYLQTSPSSLLKHGDFVFADTSEDIEGSGNFTCLNSDTPVFAGYHSVIARQKENHNYRYLSYLFDSIGFRSQIRCKVSGIKVFSITQTILKDTVVILPPAYEQNAIAEYLEEKTVQIDRVVSDIQTQIEKLKEYRQSIISEAVTGKVAI